MMRWLLRSVTVSGLALLGFVACSAEEGGGPPSAPCTDQTKGAAPICGKTCANRCGCSDCQPGAQTFIGGTAYVCQNGCFAATSGTGGSGSGGSSSGGASGSGGGDPCAGVDCNVSPPICGACTTCACCTCTNGEFKDIGGTTYVCTGDCYASGSGDGG